MKYSEEYHDFPATFHVISRKVDFLWDSVVHGAGLVACTWWIGLQSAGLKHAPSSHFFCYDSGQLISRYPHNDNSSYKITKKRRPF